MIRQPAVSGQFYPDDPVELRRTVDGYLNPAENPKRAQAIIVPHAGYVYSGQVAGEVFSAVKIPSRVILLGPNHRGIGADIAVTEATAWKTPLGDVKIDELLKNALLKGVADLAEDESAHVFEHSLEVMLPFLQCGRDPISIVPIALRQLDYEYCKRLSFEIAEVLRQQGEPVLLLASTDMNHFSDAETGQKLDSMAIEAMTAFDARQLYRVVSRHRISMCGVLPVVTALLTAEELGARRCSLIRYAHSGVVNGDNSRVVGYAGLTVE